MVTINWVQHPVGHGGFHTGHVRRQEAAPPFVWIFDCGAQALNALKDRLRLWTDANPLVDWLFISHFDLDHVNGLDTLMSRSKIHTVMVPYVNLEDLALLLLREASRGRLDRSLTDMAADPAGWLLDRGAERIIIVGGPEDDGDGALFEGPSPRGDGETPSGYLVKISPAPRPFRGGSQPLASPASGRSATARVETVQGHCEIHLHALTARGATEVLRLRPYCQAISASAQSALLAALTRLVGTPAPAGPSLGLGELAYAIARHARSTTGRNGLKALYKSHVGSSNRASMSLLSLPVLPEPQQRSFVTFVRHAPGWTTRIGARAWLNTGDAELLDPAELKAWKMHYGADLANVGMLALPHHGSDKNSDAHFQAVAPDALLVAHVRKGASKHPGSAVAAAAGSRLHCVTSDGGSGVSTELAF